MGFPLTPTSMTLDDLELLFLTFAEFGRYSPDGADGCWSIR